MKKNQSITESTFFIMIALINKRHGYGIIKYLKEKYSFQLGSGTLYGVLKNLESKKLINIYENSKKEYKINTKGIKILNEEIERLKKQIEIGNNELKQGEKI